MTATTHPFRLPEDERQRDRLAEMGQLAGGLVHELKNPLGAILLNVQMLQDQCNADELDRERLRKRIGRVEGSARHLQDIISSFLAFARPGKPDHEAVDVNELLDDLLHEWEPNLDQNRITVSFHPDPNLHLLPADPQHLRMIFGNIIANARDALLDRDPPRKLLVLTRAGKGEVRVVIANNGPPLSEDVAAHLFDPFFSAKDGGSGLGLAIVRRLAEMHGGLVTVSSDPDQGVSFTAEFDTNLGRARPQAELPPPEAEAHIHDDT